jgi:hypothetical protein
MKQLILEEGGIYFSDDDKSGLKSLNAKPHHRTRISAVS